MSLIKAKEYLKGFGLEDRVMELAGSSNSAVKLTVDELEKASNYEKWVDICKFGF